jgi:hypothetical protein
VVTIKNAVFWDVTLCVRTDVIRRATRHHVPEKDTRQAKSNPTLKHFNYISFINDEQEVKVKLFLCLNTQ